MKIAVIGSREFGNARLVDRVMAEYRATITLLVSGGADGLVRAWRLADGSRVREFSGHRGEVQSVTTSADGERLASCDESGVLRLWPSIDEDSVSTFERNGARATVAQFDAAGTILLVGWSDGLLEVRDGRIISDTAAAA